VLVGGIVVEDGVHQPAGRDRRLDLDAEAVVPLTAARRDRLSVFRQLILTVVYIRAMSHKGLV